MYYIVNEKVGVHIDNKYIAKWKDFDLGVIAEVSDENTYAKSKSKLSVIYTQNHPTDGCMQDGDYYYSSDKFIDIKLGVTISKEENNNFKIFTSQHCPEWFSLMLEVVLLSANLTIVHAAALEKDGKALLLPARGGVGKTATVVNMIRKHGWKLLGDDLIILDGNDRSIHSYLKRFVIYGYHRDLFPDLFEKKKGPVKNENISKVISKLIPIIKESLRVFPGLLNFARNHNPQQMRVLPKDIFNKSQLSVTANKIHQTIWLERVTNQGSLSRESLAREIASRSAAITLGELTYGAMNLNLCIWIMCGSGMLDYREIYEKIYNIINDCIIDGYVDILEISKDIPVAEVSEIVYSKVKIDFEF